MARTPENSETEQNISDITALGERIAQPDAIVTENILRDRSIPETSGSISREISAGTDISRLSLSAITIYRVAHKAVPETELFVHKNAIGSSLSFLEQPGDKIYSIPVFPIAPITVNIDALREQPKADLQHLAVLARRVLAQNPQQKT